MYMNIDSAVLAFAGLVVILSLVLSWIFHPAWLLLAALVGLHLFQATFTGFCPLARILNKLGMRQGQTFK